MIVKEPEAKEYSIEKQKLVTGLSPACHQLVTSLSPQERSLLVAIGDQQLSAAELQLVTSLSPKSRRVFREQWIEPCAKHGLLKKTHPESPRHPQQKYFLTELGLEVLKQLKNDATQ